MRTGFKFYIPHGFAHGFAVYLPKKLFVNINVITIILPIMAGIKWDDEQLNINWRLPLRYNII